MRLLVLSMCVAAVPVTAYADQLTRSFRDIGAYRASSPAIVPEFQTDFWRLDMTPDQVRERMQGLGYDIRRDITDVVSATDGNMRVLTEEYQREIFGRKQARPIVGSPMGIEEQTLRFIFSPPEDGIQRISTLVRDVTYKYRDGQQKLQLPAVDAAMKQKFGPGSNEGTFSDGNDRFFFRTYCYDKDANLIPSDKNCTVKNLANGIATVIKSDAREPGAVTGFTITYYSEDYDQSLMKAITKTLASIATDYKNKQLERPDLDL